jgi:hypothetical protein
MLGGGFGQKPATPGKARVVITELSFAPTGRSRGTLSVAGARTAPEAARERAEGQAVSPDDETTWKARVARLRRDRLRM